MVYIRTRAAPFRARRETTEKREVERMTQEEKKKKARYGVGGNVIYMFALAFRQCRQVPLILLCQVLLGVGENLLGLFVAPVLLGELEAAVPAGTLVRSILLFSLGLIAFSAAARYLRTAALYGRVEVRGWLSNAINMKILRTSFPNSLKADFREMYAGASEATSANDRGPEAVWDTLCQLALSVIGLALYLLLLTAMSPVVLLAAAAAAGLSFLTARYLNNWAYAHRAEVERFWKQSGYLHDRAGSREYAKDIRLFGMQRWLRDVENRVVDTYKAFSCRLEGRRLLAGVLDALLAFAQGAVIYGYLLARALEGSLSASEFLLYFSAASALSGWLGGILENLRQLQENSREISQVREFLEYPECFRFEEGEPLSPEPNGRYALTLEDVSFRYPEAKKDTLSHISLTLRPGEKLAIVGLNGAGKTTLIRLLCGLLDPTAGRVLLNGQDIRRYNRRDYYRLFSAVFQDFSVLAASVAENVAQRIQGVDMALVRRCVELAGIKEKIEALPQGYDTKLGRAVYKDAPELSGGEQQRLMLARALYKDAPIILLDEPTAALDPLAESDMYRRYNDLTRGRSAVYISHRLASTRFCDRILLLRDGGVAEEGTHDQLMARNGEYAALFQVQAQYYQKEGIKDEASR